MRVVGDEGAFGCYEGFGCCALCRGGFGVDVWGWLGGVGDGGGWMGRAYMGGTRGLLLLESF